MRLLIVITIYLLTFCNKLVAQTFTNNTGGAIPNNNTEKCFPVPVSGIGNINSTSFGLEKICLNITHPSTGELEITLKSPNGTIISLCKRRGFIGDNFTNTCFSTDAAQPISGGVAPFTGTYFAEAAVGLVNNGQNANGVWNLCIKDVFAGTTNSSGTLLDFSLTFSTRPSAPANPVTVQDCAGAIPICRPIYDELYSYVGTGTNSNEIGPGITCFSQERNSVWYTFTTQTAGIISFVITPKVFTEDYDWAVFNLTNNTCSDILTNPNIDVRCNFSGAQGPTGPNGASGGQFTPTIPVLADETYLILVSHFSNTTNGFIIDFNASTSIVFDTSYPSIKLAKPLNPCSTDQLDIEVSENVLCNSIKPTDFTVTGPGGSYAALAIKSANCIGSAAYTRTFSIKLNKTIDSAGTYQVCFNPAPASLTDLCGNNGIASCANFNINQKDTPLFNITDTICKGTSLPSLPAISLNGINGTWSPAVISNTISASYSFTASLPQCAIPTSIFVTVLPTPNLGNDTTVSICNGNAINLTTFYNTTGYTHQWTITGLPVGNPLAVGAAGSYQLQVTDTNNCIDKAILNLIIKPLTTSVDSIEICNNQLPFLWNGNTYNAPGNYLDTLLNAAGCDSILTLNLTLKPNSSSTTNIEICSKQLPFTWNGNIYNATGIFKDTIVNAAGCDSILTLNLTLKPNSSSTTNISVCNKQLPFTWNGKIYNVAGVYKDTIANTAGCDSILTLNLTLKPNTASTTNISVCSNQLPFTWNGNTYNVVGIYKDTIVNAAGCDSILTLNLTLKPNSSSTTNISVCNKQLPFKWNGNTYNVAGTYKDTIVNAAGCDSILTLNLTLKPNSSSTTNISVCSKQLPFTWNGNTYNVAGNYKDTIANAVGCDSILTLNLTLKPNSSSTTNIAVCNNQLPFTWNGNIYTAAGIFKDTIANAASCDSILTLNLTLKPNSSSTTNISICSKQLPYLWNGNFYNAAGTYNKTLTNSISCDSVAILNLFLKQTTFSTTNISICRNLLPYIWNGQTYSATGSYKDTMVNSLGCDSILTLNLAIQSTDTSKTVVVICPEKLPFLWNGNSYTSAGTYTVKLTSQSGCDSTAVIVFSIKPTPSAPTVTSNSPRCSGDTLLLYANSSTSGVTYKWTGPNGFSSQTQNVLVRNIATSFAGFYSATAILDGCVSSTVNTNVSVTQTPVTNAGADRQAYEGDTIQLLPTIASTGSLQYKWVPDLYFITPDTVRNPQLLGVKTITYYLTAIVDNQCISNTDPITIKILPRKNPFNFPNVFSPNGDGINDKWILSQLAAYSYAKVEIFNRAGTSVFSSTGYRIPWDGTYNGQKLPEGTYYYVIQPNDQNNRITGWVTLMR